MQRPFDGVLPALVPLDASGRAGPGLPFAILAEVEVLADTQLDAQLVEHAGARVAGADATRMSAYTNAKSPMRIAAPSPNRRDSPRHAPPAWWSMYDRCTASRPRRVSDPSITSSCTSANVWSSSRAAPTSTTTAVIGIAAGSHERPVAERGPQSLPTGAHEVAQRRERLADFGRHGGPAQDLGVEHRQDALVGAVTDGDEARREGHPGHGRAEMHCRAS